MYVKSGPKEEPPRIVAALKAKYQYM